MAFILAITVGFVSAHPASAVIGFPGNPKFGYGVRLDLQGQGVGQSIDLAAGMNFTWLLIEYDWSNYWPDPNIKAELHQLDTVVTLARQNKLSLVISLSNPPSWGITEQGPSIESTTLLVLEIANRYPDIVLAFELFPGANTRAGWFATPNPHNYLELYRAISASLKSKNLEIQLINTISPLVSDNSAGDNTDIDFLRELYENGWKDEESILGLRYPQITGAILAQTSSNELPVLRHYEELRSLLIEQNDGQRLIWITGFPVPNEYKSRVDLTREQADWLVDAYKLLTAQLYIGAAFYEQINPTIASSDNSTLLLPDATLHPACSLLSQLTNNTGVVIPGPTSGGYSLSKIHKVISK